MRFFHYFCLFLLITLAGCGGSTSGHLVKQHGGAKTRPDSMAERTIVLFHPYSGERLNVDYYHDGHYDPAAMAAINHLFRDRHAEVIGTIDPELIDFMVDIRTRLGLPSTVVFQILSGYRTVETNAFLAEHNKQVAHNSPHVHGGAVDFRIDGMNGSAIAEIAKTMQRGGVSYYPRDNHVHVDIGNIRTWDTK